MASCIGFGNFSKFYWLIVVSAVLKLILSSFFRLTYLNRNSMNDTFNFAIIKYPILNDHIFVYYIYYYFGFFILSFVFLLRRYLLNRNRVDYAKEDIKDDINTFKASKSLEKKEDGKLFTLIFPNFEKDTIKRYYYLQLILKISLIYMLSEMIIYYFDQKNHNNVCFWMLEILFIHIFLLKEKKYKLFKHQILSFLLILIFGFGIKLISSFFPQCEYRKVEVEERVEELEKNLKLICLNPFLQKQCDEMSYLIGNITETAKKANEDGDYKCKNSFNMYLFNGGEYLHYFIIAAALGYLIALALHSYSVVKIRPLIYEKYFSPYSIIFFIGLFGFIFNFIALIIFTMIPCGHDNNKYASEFCHSTSFKYKNNTNGEPSYTYYFDNIFAYFTELDSIIHQDKTKPLSKKPVYGYVEIFVSILLIPSLSFFKVNFDFFIIKDLGLFHLLLPEVIYQLIKEIVIFILKLITDRYDITQIIQFIIMTTGNIVTFIGVCIYLELIEIRFWGFDKDIKENIYLRGMKEVDQEEGFIDNEVTFGDRTFGINEERDSFNECPKEKSYEIN